MAPTSRRTRVASRCGGLRSMCRARLCEGSRLVFHPRSGSARIAFVVHVDRRRFLAARGWLRHLLASQLGCAPGDVPMVTGDRGKPRARALGLVVSAPSRSAGIALYATSWRMDVGVDVEAIRTMRRRRRHRGKVHVTSRASARWRLCPQPQRLPAFFQCWTRKEAYVKGIGTGLGFPLARRRCLARRPPTSDGVRLVNSPGRCRSRVRGRGRWKRPGEWVPQVPRRLGTASLADSYRPPPGCRPPRPGGAREGDDVLAETQGSDAFSH